MDYTIIDNTAVKDYLIEHNFTDYDNLPSWLECCFYQTARNHADPIEMFNICLERDELCEADFSDETFGKLVCKAALLVAYYMELYPDGGYKFDEYRPYPYNPDDYSLDLIC